jgi:hypothetical protein
MNDHVKATERARAQAAPDKAAKVPALASVKTGIRANGVAACKNNNLTQSL